MKVHFKLASLRSSLKKPGRPFAFMLKLRPTRRQTFFRWLTKNGGITYAQAIDRIWREWGIRTNDNQLCKFYQRYSKAGLLQTAPPANPPANAQKTGFIILACQTRQDALGRAGILADTRQPKSIKTKMQWHAARLQWHIEHLLRKNSIRDKSVPR